jgi:hypothetical protein
MKSELKYLEEQAWEIALLPLLITIFFFCLLRESFSLHGTFPKRI